MKRKLQIIKRKITVDFSCIKLCIYIKKTMVFLSYIIVIGDNLVLEYFVTVTKN